MKPGLIEKVALGLTPLVLAALIVMIVVEVLAAGGVK